MKNLKLWIDDIRTPPSYEWLWVRSVDGAKSVIETYERRFDIDTITISLDHDAGDYADKGGDYIKFLDWLEARGVVDTGYFFHLHSQNPVGIQNMRAIIEHNGWREIRGKIS